MNTPKPTPSQEYLCSVLHYEPDTGVFTWTNKKYHIGRTAGANTAYGYRTIHIDGQNYFAHRIAFKMMEGREPLEEIDHINNDGTDNRWSNLREATRSENLLNRAMSKDRGALWHTNEQGRKVRTELGKAVRRKGNKGTS